MHILDPDELGMLPLWRAWRAGGMGAGHLPCAGGVMDQPSWVMEALGVMDAAYEALKPQRQGEA